MIIHNPHLVPGCTCHDHREEMSLGFTNLSLNLVQCCAAGGTTHTAQTPTAPIPLWHRRQVLTLPSLLWGGGRRELYKCFQW